MIDIRKAKTAFKDYISKYDVNEPKIQIKIIHMYQVADPYTKEKMNEIARIAMHYINQRVERKEEENE